MSALMLAHSFWLDRRQVLNNVNNNILKNIAIFTEIL